MSKLLVERRVAVPYPDSYYKINDFLNDIGRDDSEADVRFYAFDLRSKWLVAEQYSVHSSVEALSDQMGDERGIVPARIRIFDEGHDAFMIPFGDAGLNVLREKLSEWHPDWDAGYVGYACAILVSVDIDGMHGKECRAIGAEIRAEVEGEERDCLEVEFRRGESCAVILEDRHVYDNRSFRAYCVEASFAQVDNIELQSADIDELNEALEWRYLDLAPKATVVGFLTWP